MAAQKGADGRRLGELHLPPQLTHTGRPINQSINQSLIFLRSERSFEVAFGFLYAYFAMFALPWVQPLATLTVRRNGWMTRG